MFKEINIKDVKENAISLIGDEWALITAGDEDAFNTMTVSWGGLGKLWNKDVATIYIRPQRYTYEFLEKNDYFTMSFLTEGKKDALRLCGSKSGRDINKPEAAELTPLFDENAPYFEEAKLVFICRKLAKGRFEPDSFIDPTIIKNYDGGDFHYIYYAEIEKVLISE